MSNLQSAELQLRAMALYPGRAELELCAPMGDVSAVSANFHALWRGTASWGLTAAAMEKGLLAGC